MLSLKPRNTQKKILGHSERVQVQEIMKITRPTRKNVAFHQENTRWNAKTAMVTAGMVDTLQLTERNTVRTSSATTVEIKS